VKNFEYFSNDTACWASGISWFYCYNGCLFWSIMDYVCITYGNVCFFINNKLVNSTYICLTVHGRNFVPDSWHHPSRVCYTFLVSIYIPEYPLPCVAMQKECYFLTSVVYCVHVGGIQFLSVIFQLREQYLLRKAKV
jgi:hypothetical protein